MNTFRLLVTLDGKLLDSFEFNDFGKALAWFDRWADAEERTVYTLEQRSLDRWVWNSGAYRGPMQALLKDPAGMGVWG